MEVKSSARVTSTAVGAEINLPAKPPKSGKGKIANDFSDFLSKGPELAPPNLKDYERPSANATAGR